MIRKCFIVIMYKCYKFEVKTQRINELSQLQR